MAVHRNYEITANMGRGEEMVKQIFSLAGNDSVILFYYTFCTQVSLNDL